MKTNARTYILQSIFCDNQSRIEGAVAIQRFVEAWYVRGWMCVGIRSLCGITLIGDPMIHCVLRVSEPLGVMVSARAACLKVLLRD
jgi:hypothetical protein